MSSSEAEFFDFSDSEFDKYFNDDPAPDSDASAMSSSEAVPTASVSSIFKHANISKGNTSSNVCYADQYTEPTSNIIILDAPKQTGTDVHADSSFDSTTGSGLLVSVSANNVDMAFTANVGINVADSAEANPARPDSSTTASNRVDSDGNPDAAQRSVTESRATAPDGRPSQPAVTPDANVGSDSSSGSDSDTKDEDPLAEIVFSQRNRSMLSFQGFLYNFERKVRHFFRNLSVSVNQTLWQ